VPSPVKIGETYYIRLAVPADIKDKAKGISVSIPIGSSSATVLVKDHMKASLRTKDPQLAKERYPAALAAAQRHWENIRNGPSDLTPKQMLALAGEMQAVFVEVFDEDPLEAETWKNVLRADEWAEGGPFRELLVGHVDFSDRLEERRLG